MSVGLACTNFAGAGRAVRGLLRWSLVLGVVSAATAQPSMQAYPFYQLDGFGTLCGALGPPIAEVGDLDGDGLRDLLVGAPGSLGCGPVVAGSVTAASGASGITILVATGASPGDRFGASVADAGDVDGDGVADLLVGAPGADPAGLTDAGQVVILSGITGVALLTVDGTSSLDHLGFSLAGMGDLDADGIPDFVAGATGSPATGVLGYARFVSGGTGLTLFTASGAAPSEMFGLSVSNAGDVDGDGLSDAIVGAPSCGLGCPPGYATVFSSASGAPLLTVSGTSLGEDFGLSVSGIGDLDADGLPDVIVGAPQGLGCLTAGPGHVEAYSGASGSVLLSLVGNLSEGGFGKSVAPVQDLDGDDVPDLAVGSGACVSPGSMRVFSGATGAPILAQTGTFGQDSGHGSPVLGLDDMNGDGFPDLAAGIRSTGTLGGAVRTYSYVGIPPGSVLSGAGCSGATGIVPLIRTGGGTPHVQGGGNPSFAVCLSNAPPGMGALLVAGLSQLFVPLGAIGLPGCSLLLYPDILIPATTSSAGRSVIPVPVPGNPALLGAVVRFQWYVVDPGPSPLPGGMTQRLDLFLQP